MRTVKFLDVAWTYREASAAFDDAYRRVMQSGWYIGGPEVERFEQAFSAMVGGAGVVGVSNGLDALVLILRALDIGPGDEVIVPGHTFIATWLAVSQTGATLVPVDVDEHTMNIDPALVEQAITPATRAIMPVHLYGNPCDMTALGAIARKHAVALIEDAAQAHLATWRGMPAGALGDAAGFSFYPGKNLGAFGDAGAATSRDAALADRIRLLGNYGSRHKYQHDECGVNARLDPLQAAFLAVKLEHLARWTQKRRQIARQYADGLRSLENRITLPGVLADADPVWHVFAIRHDDRDRVRERLGERGVQTLIHYPVAPHLTEAYKDHPGLAMRFPLPVSERIAATVLSLPMGPHLSAGDVDHVIEQVAGCTT